MSELYVLTIPVHVTENRHRPSADLRRIVGMSLDDSRMHIEHGYSLEGTEIEMDITFPDDTAKRVEDFYAQTAAVDPNMRPDYDCHVFAFYALGRATHIRHHRQLQFESHEMIAAEERLASGKTYAVVSSANKPLHSVIGIDDPCLSLSVIGIQMPIVIGSHGEIKKLYNADAMCSYAPGRAIL